MTGRGWRSRIERVSPEQVTVSVSGESRIRVQGFALGWVRCNGDLRFVWGNFDEAFVVSGESVTLVARGLSGSAGRTLNLKPKHKLREPAAPYPSAEALLLPRERRPMPRITGCRCKPQGVAIRVVVPRSVTSPGRLPHPTFLDPKTDD